MKGKFLKSQDVLLANIHRYVFLVFNKEPTQYRDRFLKILCSK